VHRGTVPPRDTTKRDGILVTTVSRTLVDCATVLDRTSLESLVDAAFCRKLATPASTISAAERAGTRRRGKALLRDTVEVWAEPIQPDSPAEVRLLRRLGELGLRNLVTQHEVRDDEGLLIARLDIAVPDLLRAFEYDGVEFHNPRRWKREEGRAEGLRRLGWRIEPVTKIDLLPGESRLGEIVRRWTSECEPVPRA
jgi:hypothetical protein